MGLIEDEDTREVRLERKNSESKCLVIEPPFKQARTSEAPVSASDPDMNSETPRVQAHRKGWDATNWDLDTQQPHGGQEWNTIPNFVEDFSVTTNYLGPPMRAISACGLALQDVEHYPPANFEPYISELAAFLQPKDPVELTPRLMLGNGASELIDLVTRKGCHEGAFTTRSKAQYKEYERAALAAGREQKATPDDKGFKMLAVINPCNPTGDYLNIEQMKDYILSTCSNGMSVLVDESMQPWHGPDWRSDSLVSQREWIRKLYDEQDIRVYVIHSWTKIWSCPGIRLGSVICPTPSLSSAMKKHQVPWSLNVFALRFFSAAIKDTEYLQQTWMTVPQLRQRTVDNLTSMFPSWEFHGEPWLSWVWIDTKCAKLASEAVAVAKKAGTPIRNGGMGYNLPTFVRLKVAGIAKQDVLLKALMPLSKPIAA